MSGFSDFLIDHHVPQLVTSTECAAAEDMFDGAASGVTTSDVANLKEWEGALFIVSKLAASTGTALVTIESCDDASASTSTAVAHWYRYATTPDIFTAWARSDSTGQTITAGANDVWEFAISSSMLYKGTASTPVNHNYVRFVLTEVADDPVDGVTTVVLFGAKHSHDIPVTVLT